MAPVPLLVFFALFHPLLICASKEDGSAFKNCPPFNCGKLGEIGLPFTNKTSPEKCSSPCVVDGCDEDSQWIQLERGGKWFELHNISQANTISITDKDLQRHLNSNSCDSFNNLSLPASLPYLSNKKIPTQTLFKCTDLIVNFPQHLEFNYKGCKNFSIYYTRNSSLPSPPPTCSILQLPVNNTESYSEIFRLLTATFSIEVFQLFPCHHCYFQKRGCKIIKGNPKCIHSIEERLKLGLGNLPPQHFNFSSAYVSATTFNENPVRSRSPFHANASSDPSLKSDPEGDTNYFGVPIFSYSELEEATNNFDSKHELGDGGKLRDGREVAVKRLYEHNRKRIKQFMNEIQILTRLRHKNLVTLYGCTSCYSRELLLVYEYIPNGTVADHLHHDRAKSGSLTWTIRMRIAIETATALAYLHATDIIHRDVKTNNILLDNNFCVKVADFGLSRLFPNDVTHISTAPQGTPGYLDPEYHQCYQLTAKSDVYSFGVVLIELISSMPAVDMTRNQHEINLATLAMNKIQKCAFDELIDPYLGYKSDEEIKRMTTSVAELAFLCLQQGKEIRPCMNEVLKELKAMESGEYELENLEQEHGDNDASKKKEPPDCDVVALLKNIRSPLSSNSTTDQWFSSSTTPNVSN
ncbi:hypothetical protein POTOM_036088 [Populus tomentosa]|uniref:Protein kinase domain-containing protein n=1 Tax=Populus tomentosa TaxID=118781 RepID=A0A8X8CMN8_POPTO|nr:hypothetical protein POTOM_036088 [Populus tomentosa]